MQYNNSVKKTMLLSNYDEITKHVKINRLYREVSLFYFRNPRDKILNIMNRNQFINHIGNYDRYKIEISKSVLFYIFKLEELRNLRFVLQLNKCHPFYPVNSYFYVDFKLYKNTVYECIKKYLNGSHEDVIKHIVSFLPNNKIMNVKEYYLKSKDIQRAFKISTIENKRNWTPTHGYSGMHVLIKKYKSVMKRYY